MRPVDSLNMLLLAAIWGASFLFMRIIAPQLGTLPTAFFRVSIAAAGLLVILALLRTRWDFQGKFKVCLRRMRSRCCRSRRARGRGWSPRRWPRPWPMPKI